MPNLKLIDENLKKKGIKLEINIHLERLVKIEEDGTEIVLAFPDLREHTFSSVVEAIETIKHLSLDIEKIQANIKGA